MSFPRYERYKDSEVEWLGEVPEHWEVMALRGLAREGRNTFIDGDWIESPFITDEGIRLIQTGNIGIGKYKEQGFRYISEQTFHDLNCTEVEPGNVLICRLAEPVGRACLAPRLDVRMITSVDVCILKPSSEVNANYMVYLFSSAQFLGYMEGQCRGGTRNRVSRGFLGAVRLAIPLFSEQQSIAAFLDRETAKIDALIAEQQRLIELLKEKRQAVISHAVTKGLNPDAPMKDSGIEWLGEVPEHWIMVAAKRIASVFVPQRNKPELNNEGNGVFWATMEDMKTEEILQTNFWVSAEAAKDAGSRILNKGSVITSCVGNFGIASINSVDLIINQQLQAYIPNPTIKAEFLRYFLSVAKVYFEQVGTAATLIYVNQQGFGNLPLALPSLVEQENIVSYLSFEASKFDALTTEAQTAITLLQERRTALISTAVTGKIDVRGLVETRPEREAAA